MANHGPPICFICPDPEMVPGIPLPADEPPPCAARLAILAQHQHEAPKTGPLNVPPSSSTTRHTGASHLRSPRLPPPPPPPPSPPSVFPRPSLGESPPRPHPSPIYRLARGAFISSASFCQHANAIFHVAKAIIPHMHLISSPLVLHTTSPPFCRGPHAIGGAS